MAYTAWSVAQDEIPDATKWNYLGGNDAHFYSFLGDNLEWQSWTPTVTAITKGNGTTTAYYARVGNTIFVRLRFVCGSTTSMASNPTFTLPVTAHADYDPVQHVVGSVYYEDYLTGAYAGSCRIVTATTFTLLPPDASSTYLTNGAISTTVPFTWTTNDYLSTQFFYEAAA